MPKSQNRWSRNDDRRLIRKVKRYNKQWTLIGRYFPDRLPKDCRERYIMHLSGMRKKLTTYDKWNIFVLRSQLGNCWSEISRQTGISPITVKNFYYSFMRKHGFILDPNDGMSALLAASLFFPTYTYIYSTIIYLHIRRLSSIFNVSIRKEK